MAYSTGYSDRFLEDVKKLDKHQRELVYKRIEKLRIIFKVIGNQVEFAWLDDRGHVYR